MKKMLEEQNKANEEANKGLEELKQKLEETIEIHKPKPKYN